MHYRRESNSSQFSVSKKKVLCESHYVRKSTQKDQVELELLTIAVDVFIEFYDVIKYETSPVLLAALRTNQICVLILMKLIGLLDTM